MEGMFYVRCGVPPPTTRASHAVPPHRPIPCPVVRRGIRQATGVGYLEGDQHAMGVPSALHANPHCPTAPRCHVSPPTSRRELSRTSPPSGLSHPQGASAFNQPLAWDTSSVTTMQGMFRVRITPQHAHCSPGATCTLRHHARVKPRLPRTGPCFVQSSRASPHRAMPCPAVRKRIRQAACVRHLERDHHASDVLCAHHATAHRVRRHAAT